MIISNPDGKSLLVLDAVGKNEETNEINYVATHKTLTEIIFPHRSIVVSVPGAFTPTCSGKHLPPFEANHDLLCSLGIDKVYILSSNDYFTLMSWGDALDIRKCSFISDCDLTFGKVYDNLLYRQNLGVRNKREIFIFNKGKVEKRFSEKYESDSDDPFENTTFDEVLSYLKSVA